MDGDTRLKYALVAVGIGLLVILGCFVLAVVVYDSANDAGTALGAATGTVGAITGAFFGHHLGSSGKEKAEDDAKKARQALENEKDKCQWLLSLLPDNKAQQALAILERYAER